MLASSGADEGFFRGVGVKTTGDCNCSFFELRLAILRPRSAVVIRWLKMLKRSTALALIA